MLVFDGTAEDSTTCSAESMRYQHVIIVRLIGNELTKTWMKDGKVTNKSCNKFE